ncbi:hypothetical protein Glove_284g67 [Diversispora epigaea]|uniref:Uncharacterized protein n=1 Tax=Diversispora epigaea TaxID=1348612 RepID=A0A397I1B4_9GLOM|nr:hypothetical protein Glove_284g67 [Diversispora epigaea]
MKENTQLKVKVTKLEYDFLEIKKQTQTITNTHEIKLQIPNSSVDYSEKMKSQVSNSLQVTSLPIGDHSDKEILFHCETKDSVTTNITLVTPEQIRNTSDSAFNSGVCQKRDSASSIGTETKSLEDKEVNDFLDSENKKKVSNEIRQSIKEKKLCDQTNH